MDLRQVVRVMLADYDAGETALLANREALRASGHRLVEHDQIETDLELRDAISGEVIFRGTFDEGMRQWADSWVDVDTVDQEVRLPETEVPGIPERLLLAVREWVENNVAEARDYAEAPA